MTNAEKIADKLNGQKAECVAAGIRYRVDAGKLSLLRLDWKEGAAVAAELERLIGKRQINAQDVTDAIATARALALGGAA